MLDGVALEEGTLLPGPNRLMWNRRHDTPLGPNPIAKASLLQGGLEKVKL